MQDHEVKSVFDTIFYSGSSANLVINEQDRKQAELLLKELIEKSCKMSVVEGIFRSTFSFNPTLSSIIKNIAKSLANNCGSAVNEGKFYTTIRDTIRLKWKSAYDIRRQTGEW